MCCTELLAIALDRSELFGIEAHDIYLALFAMGGIANAIRVELEVLIMGIIGIADEDLYASVLVD